MARCVRPLYHKKQAGLTLLEILIATLILSFGILGLAGLQVAGMKTTHNSYQMQQATWFVHDLLERMRANKVGALAGNYNATTSCSTAITCPSTGCTPSLIAAKDLKELRCGAINNELMNGNLAVSCLTGGCQNGITINLSWSERAASKVNVTDADTSTFRINLNATL